MLNIYFFDNYLFKYSEFKKIKKRILKAQNYLYFQILEN